jgi:hypothetical protein
MTPSSVAKTGASSTATINADGSVTFGSCETLSLNGVFTSSYDNYMIVMRYEKDSGSDRTAYFRMRAAGSDESSASNYYTWQRLIVDSTTVSGTRSADNKGNITQTFTGARNGLAGYFFGPQLAQPTAFRSTTVFNQSGAGIQDTVFTHSLSTSYDGFTLLLSAAESQSGLVTVFGFAQ